MGKKVETIGIDPVDHYGDCMQDSVNKSFSGDRVKPEGYVEIYEEDLNGKRKLVGKHNLVLYLGREWLAQRMVDRENSSVTPTKDEYISWLGLGDGGVISGDPFDPSPPVISDSDLSSRVMITATDSSAADYHVAGGSYPETGYYKIPFDTISFEQDAQNDDSWLVIKITVTIGALSANGKQLSEAGLFTAETSPLSGAFNIFSRVTFPSIVKTSDRRIIFNWYLYV